MSQRVEITKETLSFNKKLAHSLEVFTVHQQVAVQYSSAQTTHSKNEFKCRHIYWT